MNDSASVDSVKQEISRLVQSRKYALGRPIVRLSGITLSPAIWVQQNTRWKQYFNGLHYYGLLGDSAGYYNEYIVIGDYYTHDYFMQGTAEKYLDRALQYFELARNMPKVIESRLGLGQHCPGKGAPCQPI